MSAVAPPVRKRDQAYPWTVVGITLALSMAGNAVHAGDAHTAAVSDRTAEAGAIVPPILAALALHGLLRVLRRTPPGWPRHLVVALVVAVFGMAFAISFVGLHAFSVAIGIKGFLALFGPLIVDVTTVYAVADAMLLHRRPAAQPTQVPAAEEEPAHDPAPAAQPAHAAAPEAPPVARGELAAQTADDPQTAPIPRVQGPVALDEAAERRARVCAEIARLRTARAHVSSRALEREFGAPDGSIRHWIKKIDSGDWTVSPDGTLLIDPPQERTG